MIRHLVKVIAGYLLLSAVPAAAQTVSGCGTAAIPKASLASTAKLTTEATCFGKARDAAAAAVRARQDRIAALTPAPAAAPAPTPTPPADQDNDGAPATLQVGMNLVGIAYWSTEDPFLDKAKMLDWTSVPAENKDATGFPNSMPAGKSQLLVSTPLGATGGDYVLLYKGSLVNSSATSNQISFLGTSGIVSTPGRMAFHVDSRTWIWGINAFDPADPIREVHIVRADQETAWKAGAIINPDFVKVIGARFSPHRFMDWGCTNHSTQVHWADRPTPASASWGCVPYEVMIAEANASNADAWITLPAMADDDYVRRLVALARDTLAPGLRLHLEYSNEVWNDQFGQTKYAQQQGEAKWGTGGWFINLQFYGYRAAQVMRIARDAFASQPARLVTVWGAFTGYADPALNDRIQAGVDLAGVGTTRQLFDDYAVTTYFGDQLGSGDATDQAKILGWANGGEAGMAAAFNELEHGGGLTSNFSIDNVANLLWSVHAGEAKKRGLRLVAYEGGQSGYWFAWPAATQETMTGFLNRLKADPRMGALYRTMTAKFVAVGGAAIAPFNDVGDVSVWGPWGGQPDLIRSTPQMDALRAIGGR